MTTEDWRRFHEVGGLDQFRRARPTDAAAVARRAWAVKCLALALEEFGDRGWQAGTVPEWATLVKIARNLARTTDTPLTARELEALERLPVAEALTGAVPAVPAARMCAACGHRERGHRVPQTAGGARWPLAIVDCPDCPDGKCRL